MAEDVVISLEVNDKEIHEYTGSAVMMHDACVLKYREVDDDGAASDVIISIFDDRFRVKRLGSINTEMIFASGEDMRVSYSTAYGTVYFKLTTRTLELRKNKVPEGTFVFACYTIDYGEGAKEDLSLRLNVSRAH